MTDVWVMKLRSSLPKSCHVDHVDHVDMERENSRPTRLEQATVCLLEYAVAGLRLASRFAGRRGAKGRLRCGKNMKIT